MTVFEWPNIYMDKIHLGLYLDRGSCLQLLSCHLYERSFNFLHHIEYPDW